MKSSPLRSYANFVQAVADFVDKHGLTTMPTPGVYRRHGAEMLAHFWRKCHRDVLSLHADVELCLGRPLAEPLGRDARHRYADYPFFLGKLWAYIQQHGLTHLPSRTDLGPTGLGAYFRRHCAAHNVVADLGITFHLGAERIPARYLLSEAYLREFFGQFLQEHCLLAVPHEQQLYGFRHGKKLRGMAAQMMQEKGLSWEQLVGHLGLTMDPNAPRKRPEAFTPASVIEDMRGFIAERGHFPTQEEMIFCGYGHLLARVRTCFGTLRRLATHLGYPRRTILVAHDGHLCASFGEWRVDNVLGALGIAHRVQRRLLAGRRCTADFALASTAGHVALEVAMYDPDQPPRDTSRGRQYLQRFAAKAAAYRQAGIALVVVVAAQHADDAALRAYLTRKLATLGVVGGQPELFATATGSAAGDLGVPPPPPSDPQHRPSAYWTNPSNLLAEVRIIIQAHSLTSIPRDSFFAKFGRHDLRMAIRQYSSREALGQALGLPVETAGRKPYHYWKDLDNVAAAIAAYVAGRVPPSTVFPTLNELRAAKNYPLSNALSKLTSDQLDGLAARLGLTRRKRA